MKSEEKKKEMIICYTGPIGIEMYKRVEATFKHIRDAQNYLIANNIA